MIRMASDGIQILCLEIGHGDNRYVKLGKIFASLETKHGLNRMRLQRTPEIMDPLFALPSLEVIRPPSQLEQAITNTTLCIYPMGWFTTMFDVLTETQ